MLRWRFVAISFIPIFLLFMAVATPARAANDSLVVNDCSYGDVYQFASAGCNASVENVGTKPLTLSITAVQSGPRVEPQKLTLPPHGHATLSLHALTDNIAGAVTWTYRIDGAGDTPKFVNASGFVSSILDAGHPKIDFGIVDFNALPVMQTLALTSDVDSKMRIVKIISSPSMLHAQIGADWKYLSTKLDADAPWGSFDDVVKLAIDSTRQQQVWVQVAGSVSGDIGPTTNPHWLGEITRQEKLVLAVPLIDRRGRDFSIGNVVSKDFAATYDSGPCEPARAGCRNLLIHVSSSQPAGFFKSHLDVMLPDRDKHLLVGIWGVLGEPPSAGEVAQPPAITKIPVSLPSSDDGVTAIPPLKVQPDPPGDGPLLKWTIGQQQSVHGYQVFRSDASKGPFALMEPNIIPKIYNGRGPVAYRWRDTSAFKGRTYWYYVAVLYTSGDRRPLSEPQETVAK
jgi:hypothetical protein